MTTNNKKNINNKRSYNDYYKGLIGYNYFRGKTTGLSWADLDEMVDLCDDDKMFDCMYASQHPFQTPKKRTQKIVPNAPRKISTHKRSHDDMTLSKKIPMKCLICKCFLPNNLFKIDKLCSECFKTHCTLCGGPKTNQRHPYCEKCNNVGDCHCGGLIRSSFTMCKKCWNEKCPECMKKTNGRLIHEHIDLEEKLTEISALLKNIDKNLTQ